MTLIAGLVCRDAIVFAADSEENGGIRKTSVEKMKHVPESPMMAALGHDSKKYCSVVVSGAGNGALCDYAIQEITNKVREIGGMVEARTAIQDILRDVLQNHAPLLPVSDVTELDFRLLIGLRSPDWHSPLLFSTQGTTIVQRDQWFTWGSGSVTDYILDQMYSDPMSIEEGISAALSMLQVAKRYVSGVGGESHITVLHADGKIDQKPPWEVTEEENIASTFTQISGALLLSLLRTRTSTDANFTNHLKAFDKAVHELRKKKKQSDEYLDRILEGIGEGEN